MQQRDRAGNHIAPPNPLNVERTIEALGQVIYQIEYVKWGNEY